MSSMYTRKSKKFQRPSLLDEIKSILNQYSDDGQIFKEIIQNAEDAGASEVVFILDKNDDRERDIQLSDEKLKVHQGPTLYAYNDAKFQESDWDGIRYLRKSNKAKDPLKVGRFGLGFKSVFHLTDMPCLSSGSVFVYLDPMESTLDEEIAFLELDEPTETSQTCSDFYKLERLSTPFWNEKMNRSEGTIFQFPLRLKASELSSVCYSVDRMSKLIEKFKKEAVLTLLFLKRIKSIKIFIIKDGADDLEEIYSCALSDKTRRTYDAYKEKFVSSMVSSAERKDFETPYCCNHILEIIEISGESGESEMYSYAVSEYFGYNGSNETFLKMMQNEELSYLPLIGVAYPLVDNDIGGHVFSCLPLPLQSKSMNGMPVHVNGYFGLSQDRKDLKWMTLSTEESNDITVVWNKLLIFELLPTVYSNLIKYLVQEKYDENVVYQTWPAREKTNKKWELFLQKFYQVMQHCNCIYVTLNGGSWEVPKNTYCLQVETFENNDQLDTVEKCLLRASVKVARVPSYIVKNIEVRFVDKSLLQNVIIQWKHLYFELHPIQQSLVCSFILENADDVRILNNQELFPLMNRKYMAIQINNQSTNYFIPTKEHNTDVIPLGSHVLDLCFFERNQSLLQRLKEFAKNGNINMTTLESVNIVLGFLKSFFEICLGNKSIVRWPDSNIPASWLQDFLDYRRIHQISLKNLSGIPFILIQNGGKFLSLSSTNQKPLLSTYGSQKLSNEMENFLLSCGVWFVDSTVATQDVNDFYNAGLVLSPESANILKVLASCQENHIRKNFANMSEMLRVEFREVIKYSQQNMLPNFCFDLPLFEIYGTTNKYSTARKCKVVAVSNLPKEWKSGFADIVTLESIDKQLVMALRMTQWSFVEIAEIMFKYIKQFNDQEQVSFFSFFLNKIKHNHIKPSFLEKVKNQIKIYDQKGNVKRPIDLFEETEELRHLFYGQEESFPAKGYDTATLKMFDLKSKNKISLADINRCITNVSNADKGNDFNAFLRKVQVIFAIIIENRINVDNLLDLPWIPVSEEPPRSYPNGLKWYGQSTKEIKPFQNISDIYPVKNQFHVGSNAYICHPSIAQNFEVCFKEHPHVQYIPHMKVLLSHLQNIEESYNDNERGNFAQVIYAVYKYLDLYKSELVEYAEENEMLIWQGRKFVSINQIILSRPSCGSLEPYFYHPPQEVVDSIGTVLKEFGCVRNEFNMYVLTLQEIARKNDESYEYTADMRLAFQVVKELSRNHVEKCIANKPNIYVPVENLRLKLVPLSECFYHKFDEGTTFLSKNFVLHHELGGDIPKQLQIPTLVSKLLTGNKSNIFKPWGQREPLTQRLRKLLDDYQDGLTIIKEMIQNADDAGASQVKFLYDKRQNKNLNTHLFDPGMRNWQGPALFVYNNAMFSEDDFHNITCIGAATKELDITKIGRFGLGFNSVYHLTDVPSFLSDRSVVFFDPHITYLENVLGNQGIPGIRVSLEDFSKDIVDFRDQFLVFQEIFGVNFDFSKDSFESYKGTLFRLPLRTEETARKSEIKKIPYSNEEMMKLFKKMETFLDTLLLFSENVSSVEVYILDSMAQSPKEMKLLFSTHKLTTMKSKNVIQLAQEKLHAVKSNISHQIPYEEINNLPGMVFETEIETTRNDEKTTRNWLVSLCVGSHRTFQFAAEHDGLVPYGGVAIEIKGKEKTVSPMESGQFYCFLPLPIDSLLPVHVNGAFEIDKNRRELKKYNKDDKMFGKEEWNVLLAEDLAEAYYNLIKYIQSYFSMPLQTLLSCLPTMASEKNSVSCMIMRKFIKSFINTKVPLIPVEGKTKMIFWHQIKKLIVSREIFNVAIMFMNSWYRFTGEEIYCVEIPKYFEKLVISCQTGYVHLVQENDVLLTFLRSMDNVPFPVEQRNLLINYILEIRKSSKEIGCDLTNTIWVPTLPNGNLKKPCELVKRNSKAGELFTEHDEVFPLVKDRHLPYLEDLGMHSFGLPWVMILDRAQTIENLGSIRLETATTRSEKLMYFIKSAEQICPQDILERLMITRFLRVLQKPKQCIFNNWYGSKCLFNSPNIMYPMKYCYLVSSSQLVCKGNIPERQLQLDNKMPKFEMLTLQLNDLISLYKEKVSKPVKDVLLEIYQFLHDNWSYYNNEEKKELSNMECVLTNEMKLTRPSKVYIHASFSLTGYISTLNDVLKSNDLITFFKSIGVKDNCTTMDYTKAVEEMKSVYKEEPLSEVHFIEICFLISQICEQRTRIKDEPDKLEWYVPDVNSVLQNQKVLCYKDFTDEYLEDELYISESLSQHCVIKVLNIKPSSAVKYLKKANIVNHWIPFGQNEKLTTRITNILHGYSEPIDVMKEMFQNADDSGASEITFILDKYQHGQKTVFSEKWKDLQGPALLVCNNGIFKREDLMSIQSLGNANKKENPLTTGKYGIGFNSVYSITDCPALLANVKDMGDMLCIFDPNLQYAVAASPDSPGSMVEDAHRFLNDYDDVRSSFRLDKLDVTRETVFRLPLRNEETAEISEISKKPTTVSDIEKIFQEVMRRASDYLLFLLNLKTITFTVIESTGEMKTHTYKAKSYDITEKRLKEFRRFQKEYVRKLGNVGSLMNSERRLTRSVCVRHFENDKFLNAWHWNVVEQCGFSNMTSVDEDVKQLIDDNELHLIPKGGIAKLSKETCCIVCEELVEKAGESDLNTTRSLDSNVVFCTLPLNVETGIPAVVNGNFVLEYETRRSLINSKQNIAYKWNKSIIKSCVVPCYVQYLEKMADELGGKYDVEQIPTSKDNAENQRRTQKDDNEILKESEIEDKQKSKYNKKIMSYYAFFPYLSKDFDDYWKSLAEEFYIQIYNKALLAVHKNSEITFCNAENNFLQFSDKESLETRWQQNLLHILKSLYLDVDIIPFKISKSFETINRPLTKMTPLEVSKRLKEVSVKILPTNRVTWPVNKTVFGNVINICDVLQYLQNSKSLNEENISLEGLPLCLTASRKLQTFSQDFPKYISSFSDLFNDETKDLFLHSSLINIINSKDKFINYENGMLLQLTFEVLSKLLDDTLPKELKNEVNPIKLEEIKVISKEWISKFWKCVLSILNEEKRYEEWRLEEQQHQENLTESLLIKQENKSYSLSFSLSDDQLCKEQPGMTPLKTQLHKIEDWSLVIAERNTVEYLLPIKKSKFILKMEKSYVDQNAKKILREKVGIFELGKFSKHKESFRNYIYEVYPAKISEEIFSSIELCEEITDACLFANEHNFIQNLNEYEAGIILQLLQQLLPTDISSLLKEKIIQLPLFARCDGTLANGKGNVYIHPPKVPLDGILTIESISNVKIIRNKNNDLKKLFAALNFTYQAEMEYYIQHVIPHFDKINKEEALVHVKYLKTMSGHLNEEERRCIFERLKNVKLIPCRTGERKRCCDLYYSQREIFKAMQTDSDFIENNKEMESRDWIDFLKELGFHYILDQELIITYAKKLEREENKEKLFRVSKIICERIFAMILPLRHEDIWKFEEFLRKLSIIQFLPSERFQSEKDELESVFPSRNSEVSRMSYTEGVVPSNKYLVWTTEYVLPHHAVNHGRLQPQVWKKMKDILQINSVSDDSAVQHLRNIMNLDENFTFKSVTCKELKKFSDIYKKSLEAFYKLVSKKGSTVDPSKVQDISFILVNDSKEVDVPRKCLLRSESNIAPYLNTVDETLGNYFKVFERFQCCRISNVSHYANVLHDINQRSKGSRLEPNDVFAAEKATSKLSQVLMKQGYQYTGILYLPTTTMNDQKSTKLTLSKECIFVDDFSDESRLKSFEGPILPLKYSESAEYPHVNERLITSLPGDVAPQRIRECIKEVLKEPIQIVYGSNNHPGITLKKRLQNPVFVENFKRLLSHEHDLPETTCQSINKLFQNVVFVVLKSLITNYLYKNNKVEGSEEKMDYFIEEKENKLHLYFAECFDSNEDQMYKRFSEMILEKIKHKSEGKVSMLLPGLLQKPIQELSAYLDKNRIKRGKSTPRMTVVPDMGNRIRKEHIALLLTGVTEFEQDECVAADMSGNEDYIYAKVIRLLDGEKPGERVYEVQIGDEEKKEMHESKLYKFDRGYEKTTENSSEGYQMQAIANNTTYDDNENLSDDTDDFTEECLRKGYDKIIDEIRQIIKSIRGKPEDVRKSTVRRLILTWHPDKHKEKTKDLATRVFQFLQNELKKSPESQQFERQHSEWRRKAEQRRSYSQQFYKKHQQSGYTYSSSNGRFFFSSGDQNNESYFESAPPRYSYTSAPPPRYSNTNPQPPEARRWMQQALCDLQTVIEILDRNQKAYEWICFISHQAAEKAIKSAIFLTDYKELGTVHKLVNLVTKYLPNDGELEVKAANLERLVINIEKTKYPNLWHIPKIPNNSYSRKQASDAVEFAQRIIEHIQNKYDFDE